jgi:hypothetical protein
MIVSFTRKLLFEQLDVPEGEGEEILSRLIQFVHARLHIQFWSLLGRLQDNGCLQSPKKPLQHTKCRIHMNF